MVIPAKLAAHNYVCNQLGIGSRFSKVHIYIPRRATQVSYDSTTEATASWSTVEATLRVHCSHCMHITPVTVAAVYPQSTLNGGIGVCIFKFQESDLRSAADKSFSLAAPALLEQFTYFYSHSKLSVIIQKMFKNSSISSEDLVFTAYFWLSDICVTLCNSTVVFNIFALMLMSALWS